ncbi:GntR family transcriptional regulator [Geodermatophilus sp. DF01-2]|uniref:GntR family transcriptional regulator n=1 Tax=Geodermatophilus sp. DF01-2 TaxID=2559610 RepID=UPI0010734D0B|nr:GntR family transcriptional regulator [Geodermatophilus sp. DF01_2]TFV63802.1 GntR family transcriptional regulator [Geodermatophilus sp. DF01_2]
MARPQLSDEAAAYVRELVLTGQLKAGEFLRVERLAEELDMSATPVREGLLALRGEGFVELAPRRGFVVAELSEEDVRDLFWVQAQIAGELAARATRRMGAEQLDRLGTLQAELVEALARDDLDEVERCNHAFHRVLNLAAAAPKLTWLLRTATRYVPQRFYHRVGGWPDASLHDHAAILDGLRLADPDAVRLAMEKHIAHAGELLIAHAGLPGVAAAGDGD